MRNPWTHLIRHRLSNPTLHAQRDTKTALWDPFQGDSGLTHSSNALAGAKRRLVRIDGRELQAFHWALTCHHQKNSHRNWWILTAVPWSGGSRFYKSQSQKEEPIPSHWCATQRGAWTSTDTQEGAPLCQLCCYPSHLVSMTARACYFCKYTDLAQNLSTSCLQFCKAFQHLFSELKLVDYDSSSIIAMPVDLRQKI